MLVDDPLGDRQTQPGTGPIAAIEILKGMGQVIRGETRPVIFHHYPDFSPAFRQGCSDGYFTASMADAVGQQIDQLTA